ncbi:MAG: hypothetical protein ABI175_17475, partial [Polyangiales bacterium]
GPAGGGGIGTGSIGFRPSSLQTPFRPRISLGTITVVGGLDRVIVRRFIRRQFPQLDACYATALAKDAALAGTLTLSFDLDVIGTVKNVRATGITGSLPGCAVKAIEAIKFPSGDGKTNQIKLAVQLSPQAPAAPPAVPPPPPNAWTPYAVVHAPQPADPSTVDAVQVEIRARLAELEACFATTNGSVRALIGITADGHVQRARVGGLGVRGPEVCLARALQKLAIVAPAAPVELACDLVRGAPQPWRVTREGYAVFEVDGMRVLSPDGASHAFGEVDEQLAPSLGVPGGGVLVLAAPDAPGDAIERVVLQASRAGVSVIAVTATGGPPVFVGVGPDLETTIDGAGNLGISVTKGIARVCTDRAEVTATAPVVDPAALDALIAAGVGACKMPCTAASVGVTGDYIGKDLVAVSAAARRAKLATIVSGQGCP